VTEPDEISDDVNAYFQKGTLPETGKWYISVRFVKKTWEIIVPTAIKKIC
jgi:hypothetical protein